MYRRRPRPEREIHFSFDSFLDVVANVVGIILRLIIVAWVGARSYKVVVPKPAASLTVEASTELPEPTDPLTPELERQRRELTQAQAQLLDQLKQWEKARDQVALTARDLDALKTHLRALDEERAALSQKSSADSKNSQAVALSVAQLQERSRRVIAEIEAVRKLPPLKRTLRYRTPVSKELQTDELMFECYRGRVTLIEVSALEKEARQTFAEKREQLRTTWEVTDVTPPHGAFRMRYVFERMRGDMEAYADSSPPPADVGFSCGLTECVYEPVQEERGESLEAALSPGSVFRRLADHIEPAETAVTMWVYPDSFALFRQLRDYLYERNIVVAGRPVMEGGSIGASSRHGTKSRGQ